MAQLLSACGGMGVLYIVQYNVESPANMRRGFSKASERLIMPMRNKTAINTDLGDFSFSWEKGEREFH